MKLQDDFIYVFGTRRKGAETSTASRKAVDSVFPEVVRRDCEIGKNSLKVMAPVDSVRQRKVNRLGGELCIVWLGEETQTIRPRGVSKPCKILN